MASTTGNHSLTYPNEDTTNWYATWAALMQQMSDYMDEPGAVYISQLTDALSNPVMTISGATNPVNYLDMINGKAGVGPVITALGDDSAVDITFTPKGAGNLILDGLSWPNADGSADELIITDGSGALSFVDASAVMSNVAVSEIGDVTIATIQSNEVLMWTGAAWINRTYAEANLQEVVSGTTNQIAINASNVLTIVTNPVIPGLARMSVPDGTTAQRPGSPAAADLRFNTTDSDFEGYDGTAWVAMGKGGWVLTEAITLTTNVSSIDIDISDGQEYKIEIFNMSCSSTNTVVWMRTSTDGGSTFEAGTSDYKYQWIQHDTSTSNGIYTEDNTHSSMISTDSILNEAGDLHGTIRIYAPNETQKTFIRTEWFLDHTTNALRYDAFGCRTTAEDNDYFRIMASGGDITSGTKYYVYKLRV